MMKLAPYQEDAIDSLVGAFRTLLQTSHNGTQIVFKSPTGSGKTIMVAEMLERLTQEDFPNDHVFIWACMYKLHLQSKEKLARYLRDTSYKLIELNELPSGELSSNTILFTNWEGMTKKDRKTRDWSNNAVAIGENGKNLQEVLEKTREAGKEVVLIVDESHQTYFGPNSQELVKEVIRPKLILEVSATPRLSLPDGYYEKNLGRFIEVPFAEVVASGLIKQETRINYGIESHLEAKSSDEAIIDAAIEQRAQLSLIYEKRGLDINPLILIQLPTEDSERLSALDQTVKIKIEDFLQTRGITYENGKLAVWLSDEKVNKEKLEENSSQVEVLIFKKAIATGWDCPRAQIMVMLHDMKSEVFKIQTVGRILRMPEAKHYDDAELNSAYVYTNLGSIVIEPENKDALAFFKIHVSKIRDSIKNIELPSVYLHRTDFHDLTASFRPILFKHLDSYFKITIDDMQDQRLLKIERKIDVAIDEFTRPILSDVLVKNLDEIDKANVQTLSASVDQSQIENMFRYALKGWTAPYNFTRSIERLKPTLYDWFAYAGFGRDKIDVIQQILVCSEENQAIFSEIIDRAKVEFEDTRHEAIDLKRSVTEFKFQIPLSDQFGENYEEISSTKHALDPHYIHKNRPQTEEKFEKQLESSSKVLWWYKNGEKMQHYFAIRFIAEDEATGIKKPAAFYPDYIIQFSDGTIGIFDTKAGITVETNDTKLKANALYKYLEDNKELKVTGGIIDVRQDGSFWWQNDKDYDPKSLRKWRLFDLL